MIMFSIDLQHTSQIGGAERGASMLTVQATAETTLAYACLAAARCKSVLV